MAMNLACRPIVFHLALLVAVFDCGQPTVADESLPPEEAVGFNQHIRPILSENCFACHGHDAHSREADLRLDTLEGALADRGGYAAVMPKEPDNSALIKRITAADDGQRMPPPDSGKQLSDRQIELLRRWIEQGANWQPHWSFIPPRRPPVPAATRADWPRNAIDHFVLARLEHEGLAPSENADRRTILRRVTLDLTGLPPTPEEVSAFLADTSPDAFDKVVDRLLSSTRYGERMALDWLDAARYSDTYGYHEDEARAMWLWRDWVIAAFNRNQRFDEFTIEQLAGDLLPNPTTDELVASGFNRLHGVTGSGIAAEYRAETIVDRTTTTATTWLGLTMNCARCHDHKYDPIKQKEFYRLYAFFATTADDALIAGENTNQDAHGNLDPVVRIPASEQAEDLARLGTEIEELERQLVRGDAGDNEHPDPSARLAELKTEREKIVREIPTTMIMGEMEDPPDVFFLNRGLYDQPGEKVTPGVPDWLPPLPEKVKTDRLAFARWLVDPVHPLTARVTVNRYWQMCFGIGIVPTPENFGAQGQGPSHPELLDFLAVQFVESGWNVKSLIRRIVTSATYRQSSQASTALVTRDPDNRLLARGPRYRLPAEMIRDSALDVSGLLVEKIGGPSVKPYQPDGIWKEMANATYEQDHGEDLYRRSLYVYRKRSVPPPNMTAFDAPNHETCTVRRQRTNTPLMALVTLNDPTFVEAARALAERLLSEPSLRAASPRERIAFATELAIARPPHRKESQILHDVYRRQRASYNRDAKAAAALLAVGESPRRDDLDQAEHATWTVVANVILNMDEFLTKE